MKGNISLYSKEGQGTTFVVTLPISEQQREADDAVGLCRRHRQAQDTYC